MDILSKRPGWQGDFPALSSTNNAITSPESDDYNCIAWAVLDTDAFWWPDADGFWPEGAPRELTISAFEAAYRTRGYEPCDRFEPEEGWEKIAIFAKNGKPTHAARQLADGTWTSKLGPFEDISHHSCKDLEGPLYGHAVKAMKRSVK